MFILFPFSPVLLWFGVSPPLFLLLWVTQRKQFSSRPVRSQLQQVKGYTVLHTNGDLLKTKDPQTASLCVKSHQQLLPLPDT